MSRNYTCENGDHGMMPDEKCEECGSFSDCCDCETTDGKLPPLTEAAIDAAMSAEAKAKGGRG